MLQRQNAVAALFCYMVGFCCTASLGCTKQNECEQATAGIKSAAARLNALTDSAAASDLKKTAGVATTLANSAKEEAAKLAKLTVTHEELKADFKAYVQLVDDAAKAADQLAKSSTAADAVLTRLEQSSVSVEKVMLDLKAVCAKGAPDCAAVGEVMQKSPTTADPATLSASMRAWAAQMATLKLEDEQVATALKKVRETVTEQANLMDQAFKLRTETQVATDALSAAMAPEEKLLKAINKTCGAK